MAKKSTGKGGIKVGIKDPKAHVSTAPKGPPGKPPKKIKMLMSLAGKKSYPEGTVYRVPQEVPVKTARSWVHSGAAEKVE